MQLQTHFRNNRILQQSVKYYMQRNFLVYCKGRIIQFFANRFQRARGGRQTFRGRENPKKTSEKIPLTAADNVHSPQGADAEHGKLSNVKTSLLYEKLSRRV